MSSCESRGGSEPLACDKRCYAYCKTGPCEPAIRDGTRATELDPKSVMACCDRAHARKATDMQDLTRLDLEKAGDLGCVPACDRFK